MHNFIDFFRRVQIPHYEQVRYIVNNSPDRELILDTFMDWQEQAPYLQSSLIDIIKNTEPWE